MVPALQGRRASEQAGPVVTGWRKPSRSYANGNCAGVAHGPGVAGVRDGRPGGDGTVLVVPAAAWRAFTARLR
jgi:hypothetical protein